MRNIIIAGNWKMNKNLQETQEFISKLKPLVNNALCKIVCCVPFVNICAALSESENSNINIGAQNCHYEINGAFTGEISAPMLRSMDVNFVIIGHSERRTYFAETNEIINRKVLSALNEKLNIILCIGETLTQREQSITKDIISIQIKTALHNVDSSNLKRIIIAYEPIWAIGTGKTATAPEAEDVCSFIRKTVADLYNDSIADEISILYGGSMKPNNAAELLRMPNIDGGLIGGASLNANDFSEIIRFATLEIEKNGG